MANEDTDIDTSLTFFTEYFVGGFENTIKFYSNVLESYKESSSLKLSSITKCIFEKSLSPIIFDSFSIIQDYMADKKNKKKANCMSKIVYDFKISEKKKIIREILVNASLDIFQSYEMQFMTVTTETGGRIRALQKFARTAISMVFNYLLFKTTPHELTSEIITNIIAGNLKCNIKYKIINHTVKDKSGKEFKTIDIFQCVGIVKPGTSKNTYYKNKTRDMNSCGYRRCFISENKSDLSIPELLGEHNVYIYNLLPDMFVDKCTNLLNHINEQDPELLEDRLKRFIKSSLDDLLTKLQNKDQLLVQDDAINNTQDIPNTTTTSTSGPTRTKLKRQARATPYSRSS